MRRKPDPLTTVEPTANMSKSIICNLSFGSVVGTVHSFSGADGAAKYDKLRSKIDRHILYGHGALPRVHPPKKKPYLFDGFAAAFYR